MASGGRVYHQDYIARIRYSNALPPPPNPPKLLEIPNTGLASGQYTSAGFASRLAREQPLNVEADAELGMPIDLVGLPAVFEGDDSVLLAPDNPIPLHPHDRALLRPLSTLGKPSSIAGGVSFLRRTEYMTAAGGGGHGGLRDTGGRRAAPKKKRQTDAEKNEPINILRSILKGFDIAHPEDAYKGQDTVQNLRAEEITPEERRAWDNPKHPTNPSLKLVDSYPVLPDLDAITETGGYIVAKFQTNPIANQGAAYDDRVDVSILRVLEPTAEQEEAYRQRLAEHEAEAEGGVRAPPQRDYDYEFFLPASGEAVRGIKRKFSATDPERDDEELYDYVNPETGKRCFRFDRVRFYETYQQAGNPQEPYEDTVAVALHDPELDVGAVPGERSRLQKGAYYYPIVQRTFIRPKRKAGRGPMGVMSQGGEEAENRVDVLEIEVRDLDEREAAVKSEFREKLETEVEGVDLDA
ncbi:putative rna polymerase ii- paf1 protein [Neofusicoccum parvum UCRNP2]|uniref:RNA polymerase II- paf1 protein n=2 Tax=Neofusicoccum parvum TaxID=310453 RepID=A0ACB5SI49_9PEZI|nr:putative rna polymerase ii- paf1 protein [Neofusicoccum parvum UCRNP2]GME42113.1 putative RNA polymerase II- paf1 protein [Neofusicoccum parvum]